MKHLIMAGLLAVFAAAPHYAAERFVGGDISELPTMEKAGSKYYDKNGKTISDLIAFSSEQGMNAMRVRLFVDPDTYQSSASDADPYACQSYDYILPICQRIKNAGMKLLLDFHYSDTWADPAAQWTPAQWASLSDSELYTKIYDYTKEVLTKLKGDGVVPDFIQTGNEISYGMCWGVKGSSNLKKAYTSQANSGTNGANLSRFANLLKNAIAACREVCPDAKIVLHTERVSQPSVLTSFYDWAESNNLNYDIIGTSYYYYYHGALSQLEAALKAIENKKYGKDIWVVETGSPLNWAINGSDSYYAVTDAGQNTFATELLELLDKHSSVTGLFWWEMDYNAYGSSPALTNWYNASLFDNKTGRASSAFYTIASWGKETSGGGDDNDDDLYPDYYLLYNNKSESWTAPGTLFTNNQDGTYTLSNVNIAHSADQYGWFAITSAYSTDWTEINNNRIGPETNNEDPTQKEWSNAISTSSNSWQVPNGTYNITFDAANNRLKVVDANSTSIGSIEADEVNGQAVYYNLQGIRVANPSNGIYIRIMNGRTTKVLIK